MADNEKDYKRHFLNEQELKETLARMCLKSVQVSVPAASQELYLQARDAMLQLVYQPELQDLYRGDAAKNELIIQATSPLLDVFEAHVDTLDALTSEVTQMVADLISYTRTWREVRIETELRLRAANGLPVFVDLQAFTAQGKKNYPIQ